MVAKAGRFAAPTGVQNQLNQPGPLDELLFVTLSAGAVNKIAEPTEHSALYS